MRAAALLIGLGVTLSVHAQEGAPEELAKKLSNPVSDLASFPAGGISGLPRHKTATRTTLLERRTLGGPMPHVADGAKSKPTSVEVASFTLLGYEAGKLGLILSV